MTEPTIRPARVEDVPTLIELITELADYEDLSDHVAADPERLREHLFGAQPVVEALVAETGSRVVAFALFFRSYSTFLTLPGLYLEDLYVRPEARGDGIGERLLRALAGIAVDRGYGRFEWSVLDWNAGAIRFYERMGAVLMPEWHTCRVAGAALAALATRPGGD